LAAVFVAHGDAGRAGDVNDEGGQTSMPNKDSKAEPPKIPAGAIAIGNDMYMVPLGKDKDGCEQFRAFSPSKAVIQVIFYRDTEGGFTTDKRKADCR